MLQRPALPAEDLQRERHGETGYNVDPICDANDDRAAENHARLWCATIAPMTANSTYSRFSLDGIVLLSWPHDETV